MTPGFFENYLTAENIIMRPYGAGEMVVFNFAYNLITLRFMKSSQQLSDTTLSTSLAELNVGELYAQCHCVYFTKFDENTLTVCTALIYYYVVYECVKCFLFLFCILCLKTVIAVIKGMLLVKYFCSTEPLFCVSQI